MTDPISYQPHRLLYLFLWLSVALLLGVVAVAIE